MKPTVCIFNRVRSKAKWVAPPARIEAPAKDLGKILQKRDIKKDQVGMRPVAVSHRGEAAGKFRSRERR
jgi:hypothetical protein